MKLQANELPVMKNQTRRRNTPKIAPLVVLALFFLTVIPIYYPLLRYPNKNSSEPSSSSRISFPDPLCRDDLSKENSHCSHQDVEKSLIIRSQDSVTTGHGGDAEKLPAQSDAEMDLETKINIKEDNLVTTHDRDVETLLKNHDTDKDVETKNTMRENNLMTSHEDDDAIVKILPRKQNPGRDVEKKPTLRKSDLVIAQSSKDAEDLPTRDLVTATNSDDTIVEPLPKKQNPGKEVDETTHPNRDEEELPPNDSVTTHDGDNRAVEILSKNQNPSKDVETKPIPRKSDLVATHPDKVVEELPTGDSVTAHDSDDTGVETLPRKQNPGKEVETKPTLRKSDFVTARPGKDVEELPTGDLGTAHSGKDAERLATSSNHDSTATTLLDKDVKRTPSTTNNERVTIHRRRDVGRSSTTSSNHVMVSPDLACDIFSGSWVPDPDGPYYTNMTCGNIQEHQNCLKFGRPDRQYLKWRWKPDGCELPIFDPYQFLELMRGKSLAFVGDSVARNHMQSLTCLLSRVEEPEDVSEVPYGSQFKRYEYRKHNFTIEIFWSPYLVRTTQTDPNDPTQSRPFNLFLDEFDEQWTTKIEPFDYVIISAGHWFFRPTMFYLKGRLAGCLYCPQSNIPHLTSYFSYRRAFRTAFRAINSLKNYRGLTFLRTFAPSHFEGGYWDKGGDCTRKRPFRNNETHLEGYNLEFYSIQVQELKIAKRLGKRRGLKFRLFDVTQAMLLRPDGHPSKYGHWPQTKVSLANDCVHWCLPGPVDAWNDFFLELLKREAIELG